jgi:hypothetical protein
VAQKIDFNLGYNSELMMDSDWYNDTDLGARILGFSFFPRLQPPPIARNREALQPPKGQFVVVVMCLPFPGPTSSVLPSSCHFSRPCLSNIPFKLHIWMNFFSDGGIAAHEIAKHMRNRNHYFSDKISN